MKKMFSTILSMLALVGVLATPAFAQTPPIQQTISTTTCTSTNHAGCAVFGATDRAAMGIQITGTFVGTLSFEQTIDGTNWVSIAMTPYNSTTTVTTTTTTGLWTTSVTNVQVRVRFSAYTSGSATVYKVATVSSRGGSGSGGGGGAPSDATFITQTPDATLTNEQALSALATGILSSTTATGVVASNSTSAAIAGLISDETGTGALTFATSPTIVTPTIASFTNATHDHSNAAGGGDLAFARTVAGGTVTTSQPWNFTQTWNDGGVVFNGVKVNITATAAANLSEIFSVYNNTSCLFAAGKSPVNTCAMAVDYGLGEIHLDVTGGVTVDQGSLTIPAASYFQTTTRGYWHSSTDRDFLIGSNGSGGVEYAIKVGAAPTLSGCGTGATVSGTNSVGRVTIGTTPGAACTITFSQAFTTNAPHCDANNETAGSLISNIVPATGSVVLTGTFTAADLVSYHCIGWQ